MTMTQIGGREVHVDTEGFLTDPGEWNEDLARVLGQNIGLELSGRHFDVIRFARRDHGEMGETPTLRRLAQAGGFTTKEMFQLFPRKPAKKMAYVSGLPKPVGCV